MAARNPAICRLWRDNLIQDEWKLSRQLTLNLGLRFDQMYQYVDANQITPRANLTWMPVEVTTFHLGYSRFFTPPSQVLAAPTMLSLFNNTTQQPSVAQAGPVLPERSHYFDAGVTHTLFPGMEIGASAYYKIARDLLDDGQFGAAYVLTAFNYPARPRPIIFWNVIALRNDIARRKFIRGSYRQP